MLERIQGTKSPKAIGGYSIATKVGSLIFTSGQLPINAKTGTIEFPNDIQKQTQQAMENVKTILDDNESSLDQVVKTNVYLKKITDFADFDETYKSYFPADFPARTAFV